MTATMTKDGRPIVMAAGLVGTERSVHSQYGEDGLIEATLAQIGAVNRWCFEVGASDGITYSNVRLLIDGGWKSVLIESSADQHEKLATLAIETGGRVQAIHEHIDDDSLDRILAACGAPLDLDLGVIDIDGRDYWIWEGMKEYRPRLMLIEFAIRDNSEFIPPRLGRQWDHPRHQAGRRAMLMLGDAKGYNAIAETHINLLFCRKDIACH